MGARRSAVTIEYCGGCGGDEIHTLKTGRPWKVTSLRVKHRPITRNATYVIFIRSGDAAIHDNRYRVTLQSSQVFVKSTLFY